MGVEEVLEPIVVVVDVALLVELAGEEIKNKSSLKIGVNLKQSYGTKS